MTPEPVTIDGKHGSIVYLDARFNPVEADDAVLARVLFDDGSSSFYTLNEPVHDATRTA